MCYHRLGGTSKSYAGSIIQGGKTTNELYNCKRAADKAFRVAAGFADLVRKPKARRRKLRLSARAND